MTPGFASAADPRIFAKRALKISLVAMAEEHTSSDNNGFILPPSIDQLIDKSKFDETITCLAVRCDRKHTQPVITHFRAYVWGSYPSQ